MSDPSSVLQRGVSVVVPAYESEGHLVELADRVGEVLDAGSIPFELVLVDDGSTDGTWEEIRSLQAEGRPVRGLRLSRNSGQHNALLAGIRVARRELIVTLDDDLQYRPESVLTLLEVFEQEEDVDVVYGTAQERRQHFARRQATALARWLLRVATGEADINRISALRAFRTELRDVFTRVDGPRVSIDVLLLWATSRISAVSVPHYGREHGRSGYSIGSLTAHALTIMVGFSSRPLRAASVLGFACTALGVLVLAYVLTRYVIQGGSVPGFPFLASTIAIFSGAQLFAIGIIGEYLARMYERVMGRPAYSIADDVGG
jgi:undecaprenyl-phosphate 4-deoxy-4-formamido-L-arabinose transferase